MLTNTLRVALRTLRRHLGYTAINVVGLGVGLACCLIIYLFVQHERSYDRFHANADRIARVGMTWVFDETELPVAPTTTKPGPWLTESLPEVVDYVRFRRTEAAIVRVDDESFREKALTYADSSLFDVLSFPLLLGDPTTALTQSQTVVLTETLARKYFGDADPMGQTLVINEGDAYEVTGVMADVSSNSHIQFDLVASFASLPEASSHDWNSSSYHTYLLLTDAEAIGRVQTAVPGLLDDWFEGSPNTPKLHVIPLTDVYLRGDLNAEWAPDGDMRRVTIFSVIALLVLLIACINYVNLATARAVDRAREVGVRKVLGAQRRGLVAQFMSEASLITGLGVALALGLAALLLPLFGALGGTALTWDVPNLPLTVLATWLVVSLIAGAYPAFALARFQPARVLKGTFRSSRSGIHLRKGLVVFQFAVATLLIASTLVIAQQMAFIQNRELGFDKEHVVVLPVDQAQRARLGVIKQAVASSSAVEGVATASHLPIDGVSVHTYNAGNQEERQLINTMRVDADFVELMGLDVIAGKPITEADVRAREGSDEACTILLNESAARHFGWTSLDAVNNTLNSAALGGATCEIKGVVADFHFESMHKPIEPLVLLAGGPFYHLLIRTAPGDLQATLADLRATWERVVPGQPFAYEFLDREYEAVYRSEQRAGRLFMAFTGLAIFVACLGLLGLTAFSVVQRTKEIGIRKVLGARVAQVVTLLAREFLGLVILAIAVAVPIAYVVVGRWLEGFAYRVSLGPGVFLLAGGLALAVALLTVSYHALRAATADPVKSLRYE